MEMRHILVFGNCFPYPNIADKILPIISGDGWADKSLELSDNIGLLDEISYNKFICPKGFDISQELSCYRID